MQAFLKEYGYVWSTDLAGHYTFGPAGCALKKNLEEYLRKTFQAQNFMEIETPLILSQKTLTESGHWDRFHDTIVRTESGKIHRVDHLVNCDFSDMQATRAALYQYNETAVDPVVIPDEFEQRDLMLKTFSGNNLVGLRPETATATFNNFPDLYRYYHETFPIKVFHIGKSFRNEVSPRNGIIRAREFTQAEFQIILDPNDNFDYDQYISDIRELFLELGIPDEKFRIREQASQERPFYAVRAWDVEVQLCELGWTEIAGIHDRGQHDLKKFARSANSAPLKKGTPHVIEIAIGIDRLLYAILETLYDSKTVKEGKSILKVPAIIAPIQVAVFPLVKNNQALVDHAKQVYLKLKRTFRTEYSEKQTIGKRYLQAAIKGIPRCVTIDKQTLEDATVTVRDRDTEEQVRLAINDLIEYLAECF